MPPTVSIIIPTLNRSECLRDCLESLWAQTYQDYEIIQVKEEGELSKLRNEGARRAKGKIFSFIDDDVVAEPGWLGAVLEGFKRSVAGVSGPSYIRKIYRRNRDMFKGKWLYDLLFLGRQKNLPGHITRSGAWTTGACEENCSYEGEVHFLEACNMSFTKEAFWSVGGFDESYKGIGDWSEPDLAFRIRQAGGKLWFTRNARLEHQPSKSGAFKKRSGDSRNRMANYELFSSRWIKPCWEHSLYKQFLRTYYAIKSNIW